MAIEGDIEINGEDIIAKSSENIKSGKKGCVKILDYYRFLDGSLAKLSFYMQMEWKMNYSKKLAYQYEKRKTKEPVFEPLKSGREDQFSTLKHSYPDLVEIISAQAIAVRKKTNLKEIPMFYLKNVVFLLTEVFQNYKDTCKTAYGIHPLYSCNTPSFTWKAGLK